MYVIIEQNAKRERGAAYERPQRCCRAQRKWPPSITEVVLAHFICPAEHSARCPLCTRSGLRAPLKSFLHTSCVRLSTQTGASAHSGRGLRVPLSVSGTLQELGCALQELCRFPKNLRCGISRLLTSGTTPPILPLSPPYPSYPYFLTGPVLSADMTSPPRGVVCSCMVHG